MYATPPDHRSFGRAPGPRRPSRPAGPISSRHSRAPFGIAVNVGWVAVVGAAFACALLPATDGAARLAVLSLAVGLASLGAAPAAAGCVAVLAFLLCDGFLVNRTGELSWHGDTDLVRLGVLLGAAAIGVGIGSAFDRAQARDE